MENQMTREAHPMNWSVLVKQYGLPPKSPFSTMGPSFADCGPSSSMDQKILPWPSGDYRRHQRAPSESFILEEQPSWLDDLLNEPGSPVKKGSHRRSASDSVAFLEVPDTLSKIENITGEKLDFSSVTSTSLTEYLDFDQLDKQILTSIFSNAELSRKQTKKSGEGFLNSCPFYKTGYSSERESSKIRNMDQLSLQAVPGNSALSMLDQARTEKTYSYNFKCSSFERGDSTSGELVDPNTDIQRPNRQSAQRSRVRKLQYISELERSVHILQAEELELSAEAAFLNQQRLILTLDNQALKQQIAVLAQEKMIKDAQRESLKKEAERLALLYRQQQQWQQHSSLQLGYVHQIPFSVGIDSQLLQFSKLNLGSLKQAESRPTHSDGAFGLVKHSGGVAAGNGNNHGTVCRNRVSEIMKSTGHSTCMVASGPKTLDGRR
eukprot:Gb_15846 [translate_table: standard]